jgi:hypothetical protein
VSFAGLMVHSCDVRRPTHTKTLQEKDIGSTLVATGVACRIEPAGDAAGSAILGIGAEKARRVFFQGDEDIRQRDILECSTGETMVVVSREPFCAGSAEVHHLEVRCSVREV